MQKSDFFFFAENCSLSMMKPKGLLATDSSVSKAGDSVHIFTSIDRRGYRRSL
jgi:hypothetical protein